MRIAIATLALHGCGLSCTDMSAPSVVEIVLEGGEWPAGLYEIEAEGFGEVAMCVVTLPSAEGDPVSCTSNGQLVLDAEGTRIEAFLAVEFTPGSFVVELLRDGELVADDHIQPDYAVDEPNGPGCGERSRATVTMAL